MKYCSKCGKELFDEAVICPGCGCPVETVNNVQTANKDIDAGVEKIAENENKILWFLIASAILGLAGLILYLFVHIVIGVILSVIAVFAIGVFDFNIKQSLKLCNYNKEDLKKIYLKAGKKIILYKYKKIITVALAICLIFYGITLGYLNAKISQIPSDLQDNYDNHPRSSWLGKMEIANDVIEYSKSDLYKLRF